MIFSLFSLLLEKNILTYQGETIFLTDILSFKKHYSAYQQSFRDLDKEPKDFFLKRLIEKKYVENSFHMKFTDQMFQEQISYRAQSLKMNEETFIKALRAGGMTLDEFKKLLSWQFYQQQFIRSFENKVDSEKNLGEEIFYEFSRFELDRKEEENKINFQTAVNKLIQEGELVKYKTFSAITTPYPVAMSALEDSMKSSLENVKVGTLSKTFSIGDKWVVIHLKSKKKKKLSEEENYRKNVMEKSYGLANNYLQQEVQNYKFHENN